MPYARVGPCDFVWRRPGQAFFEYTGPARVFLKPWESAPVAPPAPATPVVALGTKPAGELHAALSAIVGLPNLTGHLRVLAREFGTVSSKDFIDTAALCGINTHTATKQFRLGRKGIQ